MSKFKFPLNTLLIYTASDFSKYLCKVVGHVAYADQYLLKRLGYFHQGKIEYHTREFIDDTHTEVTDKFIENDVHMTKEELDNLKATLVKLEYVKNRIAVNLAKPANSTQEKYRMYKDLEEFIKSIKQKIKDEPSK